MTENVLPVFLGATTMWRLPSALMTCWAIAWSIRYFPSPSLSLIRSYLVIPSPSPSPSAVKSANGRLKSVAFLIFLSICWGTYSFNLSISDRLKFLQLLRLEVTTLLRTFKMACDALAADCKGTCSLARWQANLTALKSLLNGFLLSKPMYWSLCNGHELYLALRCILSCLTTSSIPPKRNRSDTSVGFKAEWSSEKVGITYL